MNRKVMKLLIMQNHRNMRVKQTTNILKV